MEPTFGGRRKAARAPGIGPEGEPIAIAGSSSGPIRPRLPACVGVPLQAGPPNLPGATVLPASRGCNSL